MKIIVITAVLTASVLIPSAAGATTVDTSRTSVEGQCGKSSAQSIGCARKCGSSTCAYKCEGQKCTVSIGRVASTRPKSPHPVTR